MSHSSRARVSLLLARLRPLGPVFVIVALLALLPFSTCLLKLATGLPCPACGFTRATLRLLHGDLAGSLRLHPLALPGAVLLAATIVLAATLPPGHRLWDRWVRWTLNTGALALMFAWALRLAHLLPPV